MSALFEGIPLEKMNTSMTINAPAAWLLSLYVAAAEKQGAPRSALAGTTQNDVIKEYLSRGTYIFPPEPSLKLINDVISFTYREIPKWNPMNVCSYHLQEAGATPEQELAFALATAIAVLDTVKAGGQVPDADFSTVVGRISFFVNAGVRFVTELCKMRAFAELWDEICQERYSVTDWKCWPSPCPRMRAPVRCSFRPGTKPLACRARGISSGRCACSRSWPMKPTCWNMAICSTVPPKSPARWSSSKSKRATNWPASTPWVARFRPSNRAT
jgi:(2R)-ethylmalonyl-CoA mutase